jgi:hypothetical protein
LLILHLTNEIDVNEIYVTLESDINTNFDKHVPTKEMHRKNNQLPYMNRELRKAIYNKKMYYSKFLKDKSSKNWKYNLCRCPGLHLRKIC